MKKQNLFFAVAFVIASGSFVAFAGNPKASDKDSKTEVKDVIYDLKESPSGTVLFSGNEADINTYNSINYADCDGNGPNCTYVYEQGTTTRNTSLERHQK